MFSGQTCPGGQAEEGQANIEQSRCRHSSLVGSLPPAALLDESLDPDTSILCTGGAAAAAAAPPLTTLCVDITPTLTSLLEQSDGAVEHLPSPRLTGKSAIPNVKTLPGRKG